MNGFTTVEAGEVDLTTGKVGDAVLSSTELRLLQALVARVGEVVPKATLLGDVWGLPAESRSRTLFSTIERLRKKLERDPKQPRHVITMGRVGYSFRPLPRPSSRRVGGSDLVGRTVELGLVRAALDAGRIVGLKGPGGVGKSRLAREVLPAALWCDLSQAQTPLDVLETLAAALMVGMVDPADERRELRRLSRVASQMAPDGVVLDGVDHVVEALSEMLAQWSKPHPPLIWTTQHAVEGPNVLVLEVGPLPRDDSARLFVRRAQLRRPGWVPDAREVEAVGELVALLEGLPLAVELAARWSRLVAPAELVARARVHQLPLTASDDDPRPARHHSLDAVVRWSWDALPERLQGALMAVACFPTGGRLVDVEQVLGPGGLDRIDALAVRSLIQPDGVRVRMLDSIRTFALARLAEQPELQAQLRHAHAECFARYGSDALMASLFVGGTSSFLELALEKHNLQAAIAFGLPDAAGRAALAWAAIQRALGSQAQVLPTLERVLAGAMTSVDLRARLLAALAVARRYAGDAGGAFVALDEARGLGTGVEAHAEVLKVLGTALVYHGDPAEAEQTLTEARAAFQQLGDAYGEGAVTAELACLDLRAGRIAECAGTLEAALRLFRGVGARFAEAVYLGNLGVAYMKLDRFEAARATYLQALALHKELGSRRFEAQTLSNLGLLHGLTEEYAQSIQFYEEALEAADRDGDPKDEAIARCNLAWSLLARGELVRARRHLDLASDAFDGLQLPYQQADAALTRAWLCRAEGDLVGAHTHLDRAEDLSNALGFGEVRTATMAQRGLLALARGDREQAQTWHALAVQGAAELGLERGWDGHRYLEELSAALA